MPAERASVSKVVYRVELAGWLAGECLEALPSRDTGRLIGDVRETQKGIPEVAAEVSGHA